MIKNSVRAKVGSLAEVAVHTKQPKLRCCESCTVYCVLCIRFDTVQEDRTIGTHCQRN